MYVRIMTSLFALLCAIIGYEMARPAPARGPSVLRPRMPSPSPPPELALRFDRVLRSYSCHNASLESAIDILRKQTGLNIVMRGATKDGRSGHTLATVSISLHDVTLRAVLNQIIRYVDPTLVYGVEPGGVIVVSPRLAREPRSLRVYNIRDIAPVPFEDPMVTTAGGIGNFSWQALWGGRVQPDVILSYADGRQILNHDPWPLSFEESASEPNALAATLETFLSPPYEEAHFQRVTAWGGRLLVWDNPDNQERVVSILKQLRETNHAHQQ
jgi:hypothetical protein